MTTMSVSFGALMDDLDGVEELHDLLPDLTGLPEFHALVEEDVSRTHRKAHSMNAMPIFLEALDCEPRLPSEHTIVRMILEAEEATGVEWAA